MQHGENQYKDGKYSIGHQILGQNIMANTKTRHHFILWRKSWKVARHFGSQFDRPIHHSSIARVLGHRDDISRTPQKGRERSRNVRVKSKRTYKKANLTADIGQRLAQQIQNKPMYADSKLEISVCFMYGGFTFAKVSIFSRCMKLKKVGIITKRASYRWHWNSSRLMALRKNVMTLSPSSMERISTKILFRESIPFGRAF